MAQVHVHIPSFNAGELSPLIGARFAVEKVQSGCRLMRNFIPHVHGPAFRRPGMEYMGASKGDGAKSSLRGFNFSTSTGFIIELHPAGLQVWSNGQLVPLRTSVALPYSESECAEVQMAQVNDVCYLVHPNHLPRRLVRYADNDWRLESISWKWPALGDENVRSTEIATPAVTLLRSVATEEWPEFIIPASTSYTFSVVTPLLSAATKLAQLWRWDAATSKWVIAKGFGWTTSAPAAFVAASPAAETFWRLTYTIGPLQASGAKLKVAFTAGGSTIAQLALDVAQPVSQAAATVPAGEWQMTVTSPETIPPGSTIAVQKKVGASWVAYRALELRPNLAVVTRGATLEDATDFRFVWGTPGSLTNRAMIGGTATIESIVYPVSTDITLTISAVNGNNRTLTASQAIFQTGHVGSFWQIAHRRDASSTQIYADVPTIAAEESAAIRVSGKWDVFTYGTWEAELFLERKVSGVWEVVRSWSSRKDRNIIANGEEEQEIEMRLRVSDGTSAAASGAAKPRFILETADGRVYGIVKVTAVPGSGGTLDSTGKSTTATVDVISPLFSTDATAIWSEGAWSGVNGYPRTVALHGQRLWFGGTRGEPLRLWGSVVNDYENFRTSSLDDAAVSFVPAAQQANTLQWMMSHGENLVLGTNGDEWTIGGGTDRGPITPTSVLMQRRSGYGSRYLPALLLGQTIAFVQRGGRKVRSVAAQNDGTVWQAADLTVLAEHAARVGVVQCAAMYFPLTILWAVTTSGKLLGMTFEAEQNVFAWHVHETDGQVESVAVVFGTESDEVWLQVRRGSKRQIERFDTEVFSLQFSDQKKLMYSDAAKRVTSNTAFSTATGLAHLNGKSVVILGDGAEMLPGFVVNGEVTLERPVKTAVVGLPFTSQLQPMRLDIPLRDGTAQHRQWRVSRVGLYLHESLGGEVADGPSGRFERLQFRQVATAMDAAPPLYTGEVETVIESTVRPGVDVIVRTSGALPLNVGSITVKADVFGE